MTAPKGIPDNYVFYNGEWCHPSRAPHLYPSMYSHPGFCGVEVAAAIKEGKPPKRIRQSTKPLMNKLEGEFHETLKCRFATVFPQSLRFMLGNGIWYKPDFVCWPQGFDSQNPAMRAFEVKGPHSFRGGMENLKVAAHKYPHIVWYLVWKDAGQWKEQRVYP